MNPTNEELKRLKFEALPNTIASTLRTISKDLFPNIAYLLSILAILPITSCEAERSISALRRLKIYMRSSMSQERPTGLALMNVHRDISVDMKEVINKFATNIHVR